MKNKLVIILTTVLIASNINLSAQTYYNPKDELNITLTIKEPYKPINYYEIGQNFNNMLQEEAARREALKRYYDQIYFDTKSSVSTNTYLTDDNTLNQKILLLQNVTLENLDRQNKQLKMGMIKPENYEMQLKSCYYNYINDNQVFLNLSRYKFIRLAENKNDSLINKFNNDFKIALSSITKFSIEANRTEFTAVGLAEAVSAKEEKSINQLYGFVTNICEGNLASYQKNWQEKNLIQQQKANTVKNFNNQWIKMVSKIMDSRDDKLQKLDEKEKLEYLKNERKYLDKMLGKDFMNYQFGKGRRFLYQIESNGRRFINMTEYEVEKVNQRSKANLFYKYISEFCNCGNYDPSLFD
jgi:hypothetical protein